MASKLRIRTNRNAARALLLIAFATLLTACSYSGTFAPHSGPAETGVPQKVDLWDCEGGRDGPTLADFDESLWLPVGGDPADLTADHSDGPRDRATMTLMADDRAEYRSDQGPVFIFARHGDTITYEGCRPSVMPLDEG